MSLEQAIAHYALDILVKLIIPQVPTLMVVLGTFCGVAFAFWIIRWVQQKEKNGT